MKVGDSVYYLRGTERIRCRIASTFSRGKLRGLCHLETETGHGLFHVPLSQLEPAPRTQGRRRTKA